MTLNRPILSDALSFDARAHPLNVAQAYADRLTTSVRQVCETIVTPSNESTDYNDQLHLPTHLAGFAAPSPSHNPPLARLASVSEAGPTLRAVAAEWGVSDAAVVDGRLGVKVTSDGRADGPLLGGLRPLPLPGTSSVDL